MSVVHSPGTQLQAHSVYFTEQRPSRTLRLRSRSSSERSHFLLGISTDDDLPERQRKCYERETGSTFAMGAISLCNVTDGLQKPSLCLRFPDEILSIIFEQYADRPLSLLGICKRWKAVASQTSVIWREPVFVLDDRFMRERDKHLAGMAKWLTRAKRKISLSLRVEINPSTHHRLLGVLDITKNYHDLYNTVEKLHITSHWSLLAYLFGGAQGPPMSRLKSFTIHDPWADRLRFAANVHPSFYRSFRVAPLLQEIIMHDPPVGPLKSAFAPFSLATLTSIHLHKSGHLVLKHFRFFVNRRVYNPAHYLYTFRELLASGSQLEKLTVVVTEEPHENRMSSDTETLAEYAIATVLVTGCELRLYSSKHMIAALEKRIDSLQGGKDTHTTGAVAQSGVSPLLKFGFAV
ncbi:hypothetical protein FB45DRAFT_1017878 [Roridomyces roridus]|uniref:F-box domain-containing protein n=1 Tax=Roridomyces roridus TaxID=1738132 RepID=A0AAD7G2K2_9AGAR|nr:hypothetical protein FB45DRAFT_1017878 [Roridomyces roridus]